MTAGSGNQRRDDAYEVVVHVSWVSQCRCAGGHDCRDELVCLLEGGVLDVESVCCYAGEGSIVENNLQQ